MTCKVHMDVKPDVHAVFDPATNTISYVVKDPGSNACAIVDSVMDIDYAAGRISYDHNRKAEWPASAIPKEAWLFSTQWSMQLRRVCPRI